MHDQTHHDPDRPSATEAAHPPAWQAIRVAVAGRLTVRAAAFRAAMYAEGERGDITEKVIGTALMVALALTAVGIIAAKVIGWANNIGNP